MKEAVRHLRALLIAVVALALSAGLTFGAAAPTGSFRATTVAEDNPAAGETDEVENEGDEDADPDEDTEVEGDEEAGDEEAGDGGENCATDPTALETDVTALTHGQIVCWAAHQETPEGYRNHGAWVSEWAKGEHGNGNAHQTSGKKNGKSGHTKD